MTREEAKHIVDIAFGVAKAVRRVGEERTYHEDEIREAKNMAMEALDQEPCEDAISRQTLIERINNAEEIFKSDNMESIASDDGDPFVDGVLSGVFNILQMVIQAPSVMPQHTKAEMTETKGAE